MKFHSNIFVKDSLKYLSMVLPYNVRSEAQRGYQDKSVHAALHEACDAEYTDPLCSP